MADDERLLHVNEYDRFIFRNLLPYLPAAETIDSNDSIEHALSTMRAKDYSQLPVVESGICLGSVTLQSIMRKLEKETRKGNLDGDFGNFPAKAVMDDNVTFVKPDEDILDYVDLMATKNFLLIGTRSKLEAIFTNYDLVDFFKGKTEAFLLLREIETVLRYLIRDKFGSEELKNALASFSTAADQQRTKPEELTLDELRRFILENWTKLSGLFRDRDRTSAQLQEICCLRNMVTHFRDRLLASDMQKLRNFRDQYMKLARCTK